MGLAVANTGAAAAVGAMVWVLNSVAVTTSVLVSTNVVFKSRPFPLTLVSDTTLFLFDLGILLNVSTRCLVLVALVRLMKPTI